LAQANMDKIAGNAFNIGGGPKNTISLLEILDIIKDNTGQDMVISHEEWRTGDQQYYVSNTSKFTEATGWLPKVSVDEGVQRLTDWLKNTRYSNAAEVEVSSKEAVI
jgi:CDP-paratose 2-epimerase